MSSFQGVDKKGSTVLFVDDEVNILNSIRRAILEEDYVAYFAGSGAEALKIMEETEISVIVTDMKMPGMDGLQLLKIVKEKYPDTVKIVLSGYTQLSQVLATVNHAEIFNFIAKPWDMESELKYVINKAIEHYQLKKMKIQLQQNLEIRNNAYQNVLKKMESSSALRGKQLEQIKKISKLLLATIKNQCDYESNCLAQLLSDYTEKLPGTTEYFPIHNIVEDLQLLIAQNLYSRQVDVQLKEEVVGNVQGSYTLINLAVSLLLKLLKSGENLEGLSIYIVTKKQEEKIVLTVNLFFLDSTTSYQHALPGCSRQFAEEVFHQIMDAKFTMLQKGDRQVIQLEFILEEV